jgi:hypothetical protein
MLNGIWMFKIKIIGAISTLLLATMWKAGMGQVPHVQVPAKRIPPKSYTLADPAMAYKKPVPQMEIFSTRQTIAERPVNGMQLSMANLGWGWFCHQEYRFRQQTRIPLYVRLGSVEQTNRLEGKAVAR